MSSSHCTAFTKQQCKYICPTISILLIYALYLFGHHLSCSLHLNFCTPVYYFTNSLENPYSKLSEREYHESIESVWNSDHHTSTTACNDPLKSATENPNVHLGILLTDSEIEAVSISNKLKEFHKMQIIPASLPLTATAARSSRSKKSLVTVLNGRFNECIEDNKAHRTFECFLSIDMSQIPVALYDVFTDYVVSPSMHSLST